MGVATNVRNLHRRLSASQGYGFPALHLNVRRQIDLSKQRAGDDQTALHCLAVFLEPGGDIHGIAEVRDLTLGVAALARNDGTSVEACPKARNDAESFLVSCGLFCHGILDRKKATHTRSVL